MAQRQENLVRQTTKSYRLYKEALENQAMTGLREKIPECVDFYEGRQWPRATESTKNLPRPVVNIVKMICRAKNILWPMAVFMRHRPDVLCIAFRFSGFS